MSKSAEVYCEYLVARKNFKAEEARYQIVLLKLFQTVAFSSDYQDAFVTYEKIKDEGNDDFKCQVKFKMGLHLLAGVGCYKNIAEGCKFIIEAERLGLHNAKR
ncbi:36276_t:CDS:1 [Racocetra persica]|uniref:36276_t:CDS:1 n=1 Tax=Racocetra persica TaxID=160502 RepID=A0ACA9RNF2_9GLOM|nr:36276_t:CDS:1 [Racocetra persica]